MEKITYNTVGFQLDFKDPLYISTFEKDLLQVTCADCTQMFYNRQGYRRLVDRLVEIRAPIPRQIISLSLGKVT